MLAIKCFLTFFKLNHHVIQYYKLRQRLFASCQLSNWEKFKAT